MKYRKFEDIEIELENENDKIPSEDTTYLNELLKIKKAEIDKMLKVYKKL